MSKSNVCLSCGKIIGHLYKQFDEEAKKYNEKHDIDNKNIYFDNEYSYDEIFEKLGIPRSKYCCRKYFVVGYDITDVLDNMH